MRTSLLFILAINLILLSACTGRTTITDIITQTQTETKQAQETTTTVTATQPAQAVTDTITSTITTTNTTTTTMPTTTVTTTPTATQQPRSFGVLIDTDGLKPEIITIPVGSTVTWTNRCDDPRAISIGSDVSSGNITYGQSWSYTFTQAGRFEYHETLSSDMGVWYGTVIVE